jgi:hypothetical protein
MGSFVEFGDDAGCPWHSSHLTTIPPLPHKLHSLNGVFLFSLSLVSQNVMDF